MIKHLEVVTTEGLRAHIVIDGEQLLFDPDSVHVDREAMEDPVVTIKLTVQQVTIHPPTRELGRLRDQLRTGRPIAHPEGTNP